MQKQGKGRKSLIIGIVAAVVILAAVLVLLLTQCTGGQSGATTAPSTTAATDEVPTYELYWNLDRAEYDGKSEAGMSSRMPESDGYFYVRFMLDGQEVTLKVQDRKVINKLDVMDLMGLEFDENGIVIDVIAVEDMPLQKVAWQFYVQSAGGKLIKANSSESFGGMEIQLEGNENTGVFDMTGKSGPVGCAATPIEYDRIYAVQNLAGEVTHVFIYERMNYMITHEGECQHCEKTVTWYEWTREDKLPTTSGHYQLMNDITLTGQNSMNQDDQKICLDLNGKRVDGKSGTRMFSLHNPGASLAIMDTSEGETGVMAAHGTASAQGMVVWVRYGQFHLYSGTLDGSDATTKYYGTTVTVPKNAYFYMHGGTLIGGTATWVKNSETGAYSRGYGGTMYVAGKFVMNDGEIRDGFAKSVTYNKNGTSTTTRGYGGNLFVSSTGEVELLGGVIKNGKAGSAGGNLYMDGACTVTLDGTKIQGGLITGKGKNGGSVYITAKATMIMKSGSISGGGSYNAGGNMYINGKFTMSGGSIWGGKCYNYTTKKVNETSTNYNIFLVNGTFKMYGGRIYGGVGVTDTSSTDNKTAYVGLATYATIKSDEEGAKNLTLNTGGVINCRVDTLRDSASIGINTGRGLFTAPTLEANKDKFFSDVEGAEVIYTENGLFLGREKCVCGKETHLGGCDSTKYLWACWISSSSLPKTNGNYYLTKNVTTTGQSILTKGHTVRLDLNGKTAVYDVSPTSSDGFRVYRSAFESLLVITDTTDKPGTLRSDMPSAAEVEKAVNAKLESGAYDQAKADNIIKAQKAGNFGSVLWLRGGDIVLHNGIIDGSNLNGSKSGMTVYVGANTASEDGGVTRKGTFTMYGGTIKGATSSAGGCSVYSTSNGVINIHGGVIEGGKSTNSSGANVYTYGEFNMDGGIIRDGKAEYSGGNLVVEGSKAVAVITGNAQILNGTAGTDAKKDAGRGGNVRIAGAGATLELSGNAVISGGTVLRSGSSKAGFGGNISVNTGCTMNMTGGTVENGNSEHRAGNIDVCGILNISGGTVTGGKAKYGGNIYVLNGERELNMTGGTIEKGHATYTGGNIQALGPVNITGGVVAEGKAALDSGVPSTSNSGGNVYACGELNIGGEAVMRDGYSGYNGGNITLYVDGSLKGNATISGKAQILNGMADGQRKDEFDGGYGGNIRANSNTTLTVKDEALIAGGQAIGGKYIAATKKGGGGQGGNLFMANATVNLLGGTIENGTANGGGGNIGASAATGTLVLDGVIVRDGDTGTSYGGNIRVRGNGLGLLEIKGNTQILGGKAGYGAGISLEGSNLTTVKMSGNAIIEGSEANLGGAVYIVKNVDFTITDDAQIIGGKTVTGDGRGGAVYIGSIADFAMTGKAQIVGGEALAGGAVYMNDEVSFSMADDAVITGGNVGDSGNGPAVYINKNSSFAMTGNAVIDGTEAVAKRGGAVYMASSTSTFSMDGNTKLLGMQSANNSVLGGAAYLRGTVTIGGNAQVIASNKSSTGGAIYYYIGTMTLKDNALVDATGNTCANGSAIYVYDKGATVKVQDNAVIRGGETTGSGVTIFFSASGKLVMSGGEIHGGKSAKSGGAIYTYGTIDISGGTINGGEVTNNGGAIYSTGTINLSGGTINGGETAGNGGAIYSTGSINISGGTINGGKATYGGALYVYNGGSMTMSGGSIVGGTATKSGGALALEANDNAATFTMTGGSIADGTASASGGNVWIYANKAAVPVTASISNATISGGEAKSSGGNIYISSVSTSTAPHTVTLSNTTISDGVAKTSVGGNLYVKYANVTMEGSSITDGINGIDYTSSDDKPNGGNIYLYTGANFTMNSGSITGGKTINTAGNVYVGSSGVFTMNGGSISGGAKINNAGKVTATGNSNLNVYVVSANMIMNGGSIDGRVALYNKAKLTVSGDATMACADADAQELFLNGTTEPINISGTLTADRVAKVRFNAGTTQVFSGETTEDNVARFTAFNANETVFLNGDKKLEVGKIQCICGFVGGKHIGDCNGTEHKWSAWLDASYLPTTTGYWYLTSDVQTTGNNRVGDNQNIVLDINGYTVKGTDDTARIYAFRKDDVNSKNVTLTLTDNYQGTDRTGLIQGWKENGKTKSENGSIVWLASTNDKLNLYHITLDASKNAPNGSKNGLAVSLSGSNNELNVFDSVILGGDAGKGDAVSIGSTVTSATIRLEGDVTITGIDGSAINMGGEGNVIDVSKLTSVNAPIAVEGSGVFTKGWDEDTLTIEDYFVNVVEDKAIEVYNSELALWPYHCICGMPEGKHVEGFCDETKYVWHPWTSTTTVPNTSGHYYLTDDVKSNTNTITTEQHIAIDLNGFNITRGGTGRMYTTQYTTDRSVPVSIVLTNTAKDDESILDITTSESGDQGRFVWLSGYNKSLKVYNLTVNASKAATIVHGAAFSINAQVNDKGAYMGFFNTVFNGPTTEAGGKGSILSVTGGKQSVLELQDVTINGGYSNVSTSTTGISGGAIYAGYGHLSMENVTISGAQAKTYGGAIYVGANASATMTGMIDINGTLIDGTVSGIYTNGGTIDVTDLAAGSKIGISGNAGVISANDYAADDADLTYLSADNSEQYLAIRDGKLNLLGKECMCGMPDGKHVEGFCDGTLVQWQPWSGDKAPTATGNYYLTGDVTFGTTANMSKIDADIVIDLNGHDITIPASTDADDAARMYTTYTSAGSTSNVNIKFTNTTSGTSTIKVEGVGDDGRIMWLTGSNKSLALNNVDIDLSTAITRENVRKDGLGISVAGTGNELEMFNCDITGGTSTGNGNALYVGYGNTASMTDCTATGTTVERGLRDGAASGGYGGFAYVRGTLTLNDCTIKNASAAMGGGAIYLYGNSTEKRAKLIMNGGSIEGCVATGDHAGAIDLQSDADAELEGVTIKNCSTPTWGGAIQVRVGNTLEMTDCDIIGCSATKGAGAIYLYSNTEGSPAKLIMNGCTIDGCTTDAYGGGIVAGYYSSSNPATYTYAELNDTTIKNCAAKGRGGAIHISKGSEVVLNGSTIENNTDSSRAGGIYSYAGKLSVFDSSVKNNSATGSSAKGGGIYLYQCDITLGGTVVITDNTAAGSASNLFLNSRKVLISEDKPLKSGSSIGLDSGAVTVSNDATYADKAYFHSDKTDYQVVYDGALKIVDASEHWHCICGGQPTGDPDHECVDIEFEPVSSLEYGKVESGNYYMADSFTITGTNAIELTDEVVNLCLNGKTLTPPSGKRVFYQPKTGSSVLSITSCEAGGKLVNACGSEGGLIKLDEGTHVLNLYGGITLDATAHTTTSTSTYGAAVHSKGVFNLYNATIIGSAKAGNKSPGGTVTVAKGTVMNMYGGVIRDGRTDNTSNSAGNMYLSGTLNMFGGEITGGNFNGTRNSAANNVRITNVGTLNMFGGYIDGHVIAVKNATMNISGDAKIYDPGNRGVYIYGGGTKLMIGDLGDKAQLEFIVMQDDSNVFYGSFATALDGYTLTEQDVSKIASITSAGAKRGNVVLNSDNTLSVVEAN